jgi:hypothetical protein
MFDYFAMFSTLSCLKIGEWLSAKLLTAYQYGYTFLPGVLMVRYGGRLTDGSLFLHSADTQVSLDGRHFRRSWWTCMVCYVLIVHWVCCYSDDKRKASVVV